MPRHPGRKHNGPRSTAPTAMRPDYAYLRRQGLTDRDLRRGHNQGVSGEQDPSQPASPGQETNRPVDEVPRPDSLADAMRQARQAKERGDLRRANEIMREWREGNE